MSLTAADVAEIMRLVEQSNFDELTLEMDGIKLCLRRGAPIADVPGKVAPAAAPPSPGGPGTPPSHGTESATAVGEVRSAPPPPATAVTGELDAVGSPPPPLRTAASRSPESNAVATPADLNSHPVASPLLGTFYRAPKPGAAPFVEVGAQVDEETVVGIIEVMKLMNTVRAGVRGTVTEILVTDGALAEYGETLMRVRKAG